MITLIAAVVCGLVMLTGLVLAATWLRAPSTVDHVAIEAGVSA